jgi:hypothetical protein
MPNERSELLATLRCDAMGSLVDIGKLGYGWVAALGCPKIRPVVNDW